MKFSLNCKDLDIIANMSPECIAPAIQFVWKLQRMTIEQTRSYMRSHSNGIPAIVLNIINKKIEAAEIRARKAAERRARKAAEKEAMKIAQELAEKSGTQMGFDESAWPKSTPSFKSVLTPDHLHILKWLSSNWKKIQEFFSSQRQVSRMMQPRMARHYEEIRSLISQAPALARIS